MKIIKRLLLLSFAFLVLLAGGFYAVAYFLKSGFDPEPQEYADMAPTPLELEAQKESLAKIATSKPPKAATDQPEERVITASQKSTPVAYDLAAPGGAQVRHTGRRINIALIGVDARLNERVKHADANHIISILPDSGLVEITSIPRDTKADAGYPPDSKLNILTLVRAKRGINAYLKEAAKIAELEKIDYYVEVGFSQAMGILEMLGYDDPSSKLQVLRSRTALGNGDFQRSYSQGQFVRQMLLKNFPRMTGLGGGLLVRGGLMMVETNITADVAGDIIDALEEKEFGSDPNAVTVRLVPAFPAKLKIYDFTKQETFTQLQGKIERYNKWRDPVETDFTDPVGKYNPLPTIRQALAYSRRNVERNPKAVISRLKTLFEQRAWLQVPDGEERQTIREQFLELLPGAYERIQKTDEADRVRSIISTEIEIFLKNSKL